MSSDNKIAEINEHLRTLKEKRDVDFLDPKGVGLGGKSYFAVNKKIRIYNPLSSVVGNHYVSHAQMPLSENGSISEMYIDHITGINMYATYPSNVGSHLQHLPDRESDKLHEEWFKNGSDELLHTTLENQAKAPSMAIKMPDVDDWENYSGRLVSGDEASKVFAQYADDGRHGSRRDKFRKPNEIHVVHKDGNYIYNHTTEQLRKADTWGRDVV